MLERSFDQAHGLQGWDLIPPMRVVPVVASTPGLQSLELLWWLERGCQAQGMPVAVVEGLHGLTAADARHGCRAVLQQWLHGVPPGCVVLLHAPVDALAVLLADSDARPVIAAVAEQAAVLQAYQAVKVLMQVGGLRPIVLARSSAGLPATQVVRALLQTCEKRLETVPAVWPLEYHSEQDGSHHSAQEAGLLKVLDSALVIEDAGSRHDVAHRFEPRPSTVEQILGVPDVHRQRHA